MIGIHCGIIHTKAERWRKRLVGSHFSPGVTGNSLSKKKCQTKLILFYKKEFVVWIEGTDFLDAISQERKSFISLVKTMP